MSDELLIRIDERTKSTFEDIQEIKEHLRKLNSKVADHVLKISEAEAKIAKTDTHSKDNRKIICGVGSLLIALSITLMVYLLGIN